MKTAYVLSGGGAKGAFQIGVMEYLLKKGILPDVLIGTSVGALNAAGYAYSGFDAIENIWLNIRRKKDILKMNRWSLLWASGLHNLDPLKKKIKSVVKGNPKLTSIVTSVDLRNGRLHYTSNKKVSIDTFRDAVLASSAIPFVMEPVNKVHVDGGVREVTPLKHAIDMGMDRICVILTNPINGSLGYYNPSKHNFLRFFHHGLRALDIMQTEIWVNDIKMANFVNKYVGVLPDKKKIEIQVYAPDRVLIDTLEFEPKKIRQVMEQGYQTAKKIHNP